MTRIIVLTLAAFALLTTFSGCKPETTEGGPKLIFKFVFNPNQERLNNIGQPEGLPAGHAGQSPSFNLMSSHYIELAPSAYTLLGQGVVLYHATETTQGGANAIDFDQCHPVGNNETFFSVPLKDVAAGDYEWLRVSLAYQNYDVNLYIDTTISGFTIQQDNPCTVASFIGFNTYIRSYMIKNDVMQVNDDKAQGFWGFEMTANFGGFPYHLATQGQAPAGATTVPNPLFNTSPIPAGSCVVTAPFEGTGTKLHITGNETEDIIVNVSLSTNNSFEWVEVVNDGKWEPGKGEYITDMGVRGMKPIIQ